jgi:hypothetical protein
LCVFLFRSGASEKCGWIGMFIEMNEEKRKAKKRRNLEERKRVLMLK